MTAPLSLSAIREQLAGIEGPWRWDAKHAAFIAAAPSTVARLLGIVDRVEALHAMEHAVVPVWQYGIKSGGEVCSLDGQAWPCETIAAITGEGE